MSTTPKIRVGIVGAGANTQKRHIPGLRAVAGVEIVRVCNRTDESSKRVADAFGVPSWTTDWREVTDADDTDAVVIGTWPYLHCPITVAALEHGKHVLCEARMAMDSREAHRMLAASRRRPRCVAMLVPSPFTLHIDGTVQRLVSQGHLGRLISIDVRGLASEFPDPTEPLHWRENRTLSGNNILTLGIWYEALMRWIGTAQTVTACEKTFVKKRYDPEKDAVRDIAIPDYLEVNGELECGAALNLSLTTASGLAPCRGAWLIGSEGTLAFEGGDLMGGRRGDGGLKPIAPLEHEQTGWRVEEEFVNAIRGKETISLTTFETGLRYMAFTEAVHRSAQSGQTVDVAPFCAGLLD